MKFLIKEKKRGFTLIEVILYIGIASIFFITLSSFVFGMIGIEKDADEKWSIER